MAQFSAKDLSAIEKTKQSAKKEMYKAMLTQFCRKIKTSYELGHKESILTIPPFIMGYPKYDMAKAVMYMARQLQKLGYLVDMVGPFSLKVWWTKFPTQIEETGEEMPVDILPGLVNLQKTAQKLRVTKRK
jgi:hypothetical protein